MTHNPPAWSPLDAAGLACIEHAADTILETVGVVLDDDDILTLWHEAGARVDGQRVFAPATLIRALIDHAPARFEQHARNPARNVTFGDGGTVFAPVYGPPWVRDGDNRRRFARASDLAAFIDATQRCPGLNHLGGMICEPEDLPAARRHRHLLALQLTRSDKPFMGAVITAERAADTLTALRMVHGEDATSCCRTLNLVNAVSPLTWGEGPLGALKTCARAGQAVLVTSYPLLGLTAPITPAGAAAVMLAETMAGMATAQLVQRGTPVVLGALGAPFHLQRMLPSFGTVETLRLMALMRALAQRLRVPFRTDGAITSSPTDDAQAGWEGGGMLAMVATSRPDFVLHAAGWLENGKVAGVDKFRRDCRWINQMTGHDADAQDAPAEVLPAAVDAALWRWVGEA